MGLAVLIRGSTPTVQQPITPFPHEHHEHPNQTDHVGAEFRCLAKKARSKAWLSAS